MANDWKETCAKCMDGDIEPRHCEYYGEPNGCNSPTYGEHPPVGNAAAMREALVELTDKVLDYLHKGLIQLPLSIEDAIAKARAALSAPARNCDLPNPEGRFVEFCSRYPSCSSCPHNRSSELRCDGKWLLAPAAERKGEAE